MTIELRKAGLEILRSAGFDVDAPYSVRSPQCHAVAERVGAELSARDEMTPLVLEGLVFDLFTKMHRSKRTGAPPRWLIDVRERIEAEFPKPWTLKDYAEGAGVHPVHLAARFRAHYGATVGEQIRALRVRHAMTCLQGSGETSRRSCRRYCGKASLARNASPASTSSCIQRAVSQDALVKMLEKLPLYL